VLNQQVPDAITRCCGIVSGGARAPGADVVQRLRTAYHVTGILIQRESAKTI